MEKFGLDRGIENTGITHENAQDYYSRIAEAEKEAVSSQITAQKNLLGVYTSESVQKLESSLKSANLALKIKDYELKKNEERLKFSSQGKTSAEKNEQVALEKTRELRKENLNLNKEFKDIIRSPELTERVRTLLIEKEREIEIKKDQNKGRGFSR
jgi:Ser-tRNA(Ala) deacylase AlaX